MAYAKTAEGTMAVESEETEEETEAEEEIGRREAIHFAAALVDDDVEEEPVCLGAASCAVDDEADEARGTDGEKESNFCRSITRTFPKLVANTSTDELLLFSSSSRGTVSVT